MVAPDIRVFEPDQLASAAAEQIAADIADVIAERGACRLGLAGGGTPRPIYQKLASPPLVERVAWDKLHLFWGDERCVPPEHESSNYKMVAAALIDHVPIPAQNVHRIEGELAQDDAAKAYIDALGHKPIDILLLGMGGDGHTASLFPDMPNMADASPRVIPAKGPVAPHQRVSLSMGAINEAHTVYFLISGDGKAARLAEVLQQIKAGAPVLPAAHVQPSSGRLVWLVDTGASKQIDSRDTAAQKGPVS